MNHHDLLGGQEIHDHPLALDTLKKAYEDRIVEPTLSLATVLTVSIHIADLPIFRASQKQVWR